MRSPRIAENPSAILVSVVDFYLAVYRSRCEAIAVGVECGCADHIYVGVFEETEPILRGKGFFQRWRHVDAL